MFRHLAIALLSFAAGPLVGAAHGQTAPAYPPSPTPPPPPPPPPLEYAPPDAMMQAGNEAADDCDPRAAARVVALDRRVAVLETLADKQRTYIKALEAHIRRLQGH